MPENSPVIRVDYSFPDSPRLSDEFPVFFTQSSLYPRLLQIMGQGTGFCTIAECGAGYMGHLLWVHTSIIRGRFFNWPFADWLEKITLKLFPCIEANQGPVSSVNSLLEPDDCIRLILAGVAEARRRRASRVRGSLPFILGDEKAAIRDGLESAGITCDRWATFVVPIDDNEKSMFGAFSSTARNLIRKGERLGVRGTMLESERSEQYTRAMIRARKRMGIAGAHWDPRRLSACEHALPGVLRFFMVTDTNGRILGGEGLICAGSTVTSISPWQAPEAYDEKLPVHYVLRWDIMRWAAENGFRWYDLAGVHPDPKPGSKHEGIRAFKSRWGGRYYEYLTWEVPARTR